MQSEKIPVDFKRLGEYSRRPQLFAPGTALFWSDPHISKGLLRCHLDPECDLASRYPHVVERSVQWILKESGLVSGGRVLDLGCGPGLYCYRYALAGLEVTGIDFSQRSIDYANAEAIKSGLEIDYRCMDYRGLDFVESYELVTLIYCDLGVFPPQEARKILERIYRALKPGGKFIFDLYSRREFARQAERRHWEYNEYGLFKPEPYLLFQETFIYRDEYTYLRQFITVTTEGEMDLYRFWGRCYASDEIESMLRAVGFSKIELFGDITGTPYSEKGYTLAAAVVK